MRIIPAIDILDGKCIRLTQGAYETKKVYNEHPLEVAKAFEASGIEYLHLVDLDGARSKHIVNYNTLDLIATHTNLKIDFGGGIKSTQDIITARNAGATQVTIGSIAATQPEVMVQWLEEYGADFIILGADCKNKMIATNGWMDNSAVEIIPYLQSYESKGVHYAIVTDIDKDGMLIGPSFLLYEELKTTCNLHLIASGGISNINDLVKLKAIGCEGAIIGKAIYENKINLKELSTLC